MRASKSKKGREVYLYCKVITDSNEGTDNVLLTEIERAICWQYCYKYDTVLPAFLM